VGGERSDVMKQAFRRNKVLFLASAFALALASTTVNARSYGYRHHHFHGFGYGFGYTSRAGLVQTLGN
jgi:hypothetical protein